MAPARPQILSTLLLCVTVCGVISTSPPPPTQSPSTSLQTITPCSGDSRSSTLTSCMVSLMVGTELVCVCVCVCVSECVCEREGGGRGRGRERGREREVGREQDKKGERHALEKEKDI